MPLSDTPATRVTARALHLGERIDTAGLERSDVISTAPLAFRVGANGYAVVFRYGVVVLIGLSPIEEDEVRRGLGHRVIGAFPKIEDEASVIEIAPDRDDQVTTGGPVTLKDLSPPRLLVVADALAKNVALASDEREVAKVLEQVEPFATRLATHGRAPANRRNMLRLIGQALLVHHRISGRVQVEEKPDVLWDRSDLERLASALLHKLQVIDETMRALTDIIDTERSIRLEWTIVALIIVEVLIAFYDVFWRIAK